MNIQNQLFERCKSYVAAQAIPRHVPPSPAALAVTISRETGAGGVTIGRLLADHLEMRTRGKAGSWAVFDRNLVARVLQDHALQRRLSDYMPEDSVSSFRDAFEEVIGLHPSSWTLNHKIQMTIFRLATMGNSIIVGRGGNIITRRLKHVLHVRLIAPLEQRIKQASAFHSLTAQEAARFVRRTDRARARYVRDYFHTAVDDPLQYHLLINTGPLTYDKVARIIADALLELDAPTESEPHPTRFLATA